MGISRHDNISGRFSLLDHYRKHKPSTGIPDALHEADEPALSGDEFGKCLMPFINQLPPSYRDALLQTELGKLSQKEFAEQSAISYSGAKSRIQRGRQQLFELFKECCRFSADKYGNIIEYQGKHNCSC